MYLRKHELDWLNQKTKEHIEGSLLSSSDIEYFYTHLPSNVLYEGVGYRVIYHQNHENLNLSVNRNRCFSKTQEGLDSFIKNQKFHNSKLPFKKYSCQIKGIDLSLLVLFLNKKGYEIKNRFDFEEEIIVFESEEMREII